MSLSVRPAAIKRVEHGAARTDQDLVAVEAPLEVVLSQAGAAGTRSLGLLMRTPGHDQDLVSGLLYTEGIVAGAGDLLSFVISTDAGRDRPDRADVTLGPNVELDAVVARAATATSACGLCGRVAMQTVDRGRARPPDRPQIAASIIAELPARLRSGQRLFDETGGLHAAGLFDLAGTLWLLREDIGRHNAVDKVVGAALLTGRIPAADAVLGVSGRVATEIVQKAAAAGVAAVVAVGAPSSLAIDAARAAQMTLVGFTRDGRFNVYAGAERII